MASRRARQGHRYLQPCTLSRSNFGAYWWVKSHRLRFHANSIAAGGFITQQTTWRWVFWSTSIIDGAIQLLAFLFLKETYAPKILHVKAKKIRRETGHEFLHTAWETPDRSFIKVLRTNLARPFIMLFTQPAIQVLALYRAYLYGLMYLV